jgi:CspA family cold shock protein
MGLNGSVKWYNERLGYGFLQREEGDDIFVHFSVLVEDETLEQGEEVEFEIGEGPKGPMAIKVVKV